MNIEIKTPAAIILATGIALGWIGYGFERGLAKVLAAQYIMEAAKHNAAGRIFGRIEPPCAETYPFDCGTE